MERGRKAGDRAPRPPPPVCDHFRGHRGWLSSQTCNERPSNSRALSVITEWSVSSISGTQGQILPSGNRGATASVRGGGIGGHELGLLLLCGPDDGEAGCRHLVELPHQAISNPVAIGRQRLEGTKGKGVRRTGLTLQLFLGASRGRRPGERADRNDKQHGGDFGAKTGLAGHDEGTLGPP